jgi:hypothetical protein
MSVITIQSRLVATESTRQQLWQLMAGKNTPLINELLQQVANHPDFNTWQEVGKIPVGTIKRFCEPLRNESQYIGQPGRFYTSAIALVEYIYKSWLKIQQRLKRKLEGLNRWYNMLKSDEELVRESNSNLEMIRALATDILTSHQAQNSNSDRSLSSSLFDAYEETEDIMTGCAIAYLLKNGCKIPQKPEDTKKFTKRRRKTEIKIARITEQLESRIPKGRDLTGKRWLETLITAASTIPENITQTRSWQDILLTKSKSIPFPVAYETNEDLTWFKNEKGRLCVHFNGLSEHTFEIYCDRRQLPWFERFLEDREIKRVK